MIRLRKFILGFLGAGFGIGALVAPVSSLAGAEVERFRLESSQITDGQPLPLQQVGARDGCLGGNQAPVLSWLNPPYETQSFAITLYDPDAQGGKGFWHWLVIDLPSGTRSFNPATPPPGSLTLTNDYGARGYDGACPPAGGGVHRYHFTLHALSVPRLQLPANITGAELLDKLSQHTLAVARLTATYGR